MVDGSGCFLHWIGGIMSINTLATGVLSDEEQVENLLIRRLGNRIRDLRILFLPAGLILQGRTTTYHAKQVAQHVVMEEANLPILANEIEVV
jgi:hypothetical protein